MMLLRFRVFHRSLLYTCEAPWHQKSGAGRTLAFAQCGRLSLLHKTHTNMDNTGKNFPYGARRIIPTAHHLEGQVVQVVAGRWSA
jgi:hypothetical protein